MSLVLEDAVELIAQSTPLSGIYRITNEKTGHVYIGQSVDLASRLLQHSRAIRRKSHDLIHDGEFYDFHFEILLVCPRAKLDREESAAIKAELVAGRCLYNRNPIHFVKRYPQQFPHINLANPANRGIRLA